MHLVFTVVFATGCALTGTGAVGFDANDKPSTTGTPVPDVRCGGTPDAGPKGAWRHATSSMIAALGPNHRGIDLVAAVGSATQTLSGWIVYGMPDKALEDEDVELFACSDQQWQKLGLATTDNEGKFSFALSGDARLPIGMREVYASVVGDRTGAEFLAYVAPDAQELVVSDVDGTLTSSESAFFETIAVGVEPGGQDGAAAAYTAIAAKGLPIVYLTARGNQYTGDTRQWLVDKGFPRGPVRLASEFVTLPGADTTAYKSSALGELAAQLHIAAGIGNRQSDITAYAAAGIAADRIYIKLPEYATEVKADIAAGHAIGFQSYDELRTQYVTAW